MKLSVIEFCIVIGVCYMSFYVIDLLIWSLYKNKENYENLSAKLPGWRASFNSNQFKQEHVGEQTPIGQALNVLENGLDR